MVADVAHLPGHFTGVTTYLKKSMLRGKPFCRSNVGVRRDPGRGLWVGRETDRLLTRHVNEGLQYDPGCEKHRRLGHILRELRKHCITLNSAQVPCMLSGLGIKTNLDAIGICGGEVVVIELKTTQHDRCVHLDTLYDQPCSKQPVLTNGLPNTERVHHMLQVGFGVLCAKKRLGHGVSVRGIVIVSYASSAVIHAMPRKYASTAWFARTGPMPLTVAGTRRRKRTSSTRPKVKVLSALDVVERLCLPWPSTDERAIETARRGEFAVTSSVASAPCHAVGLVLKGGIRAIGVCVAKPIASLRVIDRRLLVSKLLKCDAFIFGKHQSGNKRRQTCVLEPGKSGSWTLTKLAQPRPKQRVCRKQ